MRWLIPILKLAGAICTLCLALVGYLIWRGFVFWRGVRRRDEAILLRLDDILSALEAGKAVTAEAVLEKANSAELRPMLYWALEEKGKLDLFPREYISIEEQAKGHLAYSLCRPSESGAPPKEMQAVKRVVRHTGNRAMEFVVLRFQDGGKKSNVPEWFLGVAGPFSLDQPAPYSDVAVHTRFEIEGVMSPEELVDDYVSLLPKKAVCEERRPRKPA